VRGVSPYFHALNGRLRIKISKVKGSAQKAMEVEQLLGEVEGIWHAQANPTTGNVLIRYNPDQIEQSAVLHALERLGYLRQDEVVQTPDRRHSWALGELGGVMAETVVRTTMELAVQRLVSALI
jgi:cation transport ATPase